LIKSRYKNDEESMMESKKSFASVAVFLLVAGLFISNSFAGLVTSDTAYLSGNLDDPSPEGCFKIQVDYEVHDIGGSQYEVRFLLDHLGSDGSGETVVNMAQFIVYNKDYASHTESGSGVAPSYVSEAWTDRVVYGFQDATPPYAGTFAEGSGVSQLLVLTYDSADLPATVAIEADQFTSPNVYGEATITLIPEPATLMLLAGGALLLKKRQR
jgi:hypothetical protein